MIVFIAIHDYTNVAPKLVSSGFFKSERSVPLESPFSAR